MHADALETVVEAWGSRGEPDLSEHVELELAHAFHAYHEPGDSPPLAPDDPVPGCSCVQCIVLGRDGSIAAAEVAEGIIRQLALVDPADRLPIARRMHDRVSHDLDLPGAGWLCRRAAELPWALAPTPDPDGRGGDDLPVDEARRVSILEVAQRLGLGEPTQQGREYVVRCPLHDDHDPSLQLNPDKGAGGVWKCWPCGEGGDGIRLAELILDVGFAEAVQWIANQGRPTSRPSTT